MRARAVTHGDQHARQAEESQLKISNRTSCVVNQCQCEELRSPAGVEAKCQQAGWFSAPNQKLGEVLFIL